MADEIYFKYNNVKYKIEYNGRYGLTKAFGAAICKRHSFHLSIPVAKKNETAISCEAKFGTQIETITLSFISVGYAERLQTATGFLEITESI